MTVISAINTFVLSPLQSAPVGDTEAWFGSSSGILPQENGIVLSTNSFLEKTLFDMTINQVYVVSFDATGIDFPVSFRAIFGNVSIIVSADGSYTFNVTAPDTTNKLKFDLVLGSWHIFNIKITKTVII